MRSRFGLGVVAAAALTLLLSETQSFAGRRGCSSCGTAGSTCTVAPSAAQATVPAPTSKAPAVAAEAQPAAKVATAPATTYRTRAARRGWSRR